MKKNIIFLAILCAASQLYSSCKKSSNGLSPFAQSLRSECTTPFVGRGDSSNIYLPTVFTPNGDGINDYYVLLGGISSYANYFTSFQLSIYDTLGTLVYKTGTVSSHLLWDGTDMTTGTRSAKYKFYVKINYTTAENITDSGGTYLFLLSSDSAKHCVNRVFSDTSKYEFPDEYNYLTGSFMHGTTNEIFCN